LVVGYLSVALSSGCARAAGVDLDGSWVLHEIADSTQAKLSDVAVENVAQQ